MVTWSTPRRGYSIIRLGLAQIRAQIRILVVVVEVMVWMEETGDVFVSGRIGYL